MWDAGVSRPRDHSGAWPWKGSGLVGIRHSNLRDASGVSWGKKERKREREREYNVGLCCEKTSM